MWLCGYFQSSRFDCSKDQCTPTCPPTSDQVTSLTPEIRIQIQIQIQINTQKDKKIHYAPLPAHQLMTILTTSVLTPFWYFLKQVGAPKQK